MTMVVAKPGEAFESLLKRFKKAVERSGVLADLKKHEFYEKPSVKKKRKKIAAKKRALKRISKERTPKPTGGGQNFKFNKDKTEKIQTAPPKMQKDEDGKDRKPYYKREDLNDGKPYKKPYKKDYSKDRRPPTKSEPLKLEDNKS